MIPLFKVRMSPTIMEEIEPTIKSGYIAQGPKVDEFEQEVFKNLSLESVPVAVNSATSAIELALDLIGVGPGDEVISTPMTCFASNVGVLRRGAKLVWADVYPSTGNINVYDAASLRTDKTKAIISVDWAGQIADHQALKLTGLPVIEDAAHVWDHYYHNRPRGDYIAYSLQAIKFLTAGDGGLLVTPDDTRKLARMKRWYGLDRDNNENFRATQDIQTLGYKFNMNDIDAAIGLANLRYANNSVVKHKANAAYLYNTLHEQVKFATMPYYENDSSYWIFPIIMNNGVDRDHFERYMNLCGIQTAQVHFRNDQYTLTKEFSTRPLYGLDEFAKHQTNIPCGWWLDRKDLDYIAEKVIEFGVSGGA